MELRDNKAGQNLNPSAKLGSVCKSCPSTTGTTPRISSAPCVWKSHMFRLHLLLDTQPGRERYLFCRLMKWSPAQGRLSGTMYPGGIKWLSKLQCNQTCCWKDLPWWLEPRNVSEMQTESSSCANPAALCLPQDCLGKQGGQLTESSGPQSGSVLRSPGTQPNSAPALGF